MVTLSILAKVENNRLQKAVDALISGAYTIRLASQTEAEVRGFVANGDGRTYGVVLSEGQHFCSCPDSMYRKSICKHAVALALYAIRNANAEQPRQPKEWHVGDTVERNGQTGTVVCVSGEYISIRWDNGKIFPLASAELEAA